jgi:hypothetical protein
LPKKEILRVLCPDGTALDAATGNKLRDYPGTERVQEFAYDRGVFFTVIGWLYLGTTDGRVRCFVDESAIQEGE